MLEIIFGLIPLIFICSAIGVILLNFESVALYIVYVISMVIQPHELINASFKDYNKTTSAPAAKMKFNPLTPFIRIGTLFKVLFFPNFELNDILPKKETQSVPTETVLSKKTAEAVSKYKIKSYSAVGNKESQFKYSYEPGVMPTKVSPEFKKTFPNLVKETPVDETISMNVQNSRAPEFEVEKPDVILPANSQALPEKPVPPYVEKPADVKMTPPPPLEEPKPVTQVAPTIVSPPIVKPSASIPQPTAKTNSEVVQPAHTTAAEEEKKSQPFDAIAALEAKVTRMKESTLPVQPKPVTMPSENTALKVSTVVSPAKETPPSSNYSSIIESPKSVPPKSTILPNAEPSVMLPKLDLNAIKASITDDIPHPTQPQKYTIDKEALAKDIHVTHVNDATVNMSNIVSVFVKVLTYTTLSLPILLFLGNIFVYLYSNHFDFSTLGGYPQWVSNGIESFIKNSVLPIVNGRK